MTPAVKAALAARITYTLFEYEHDPNTVAYGLEAAEALGLGPDRVFKTLVVSLTAAKDPTAVAIVPVSTRLNLKAFAIAVHAKKAILAEAREAEKATGYVLGGISPLGQRRRLPTYLDRSALNFPTVYVSAGKRGLQMELAPSDLLHLCAAIPVDISH